MSNIEDRVKKIVAEQLGVKEDVAMGGALRQVRMQRASPAARYDERG